MNLDLFEQKSIEEFNSIAVSYNQGLLKFYFNKCYKFIDDILQQYLKKDARILDLSCGTGDVCLNLSIKYPNAKIFGVDISQKSIEIAQQKDRKFLINYQIGSVKKLQFDNNFFDIIICSNAFHHYMDKDRVLIEIKRILKNGGLFVLIDPLEDNIIKKIWIKILNIMYKENGFVQYSNTNFLIAECKKLNFQIILKHSLYYFVNVLILRKI